MRRTKVKQADYNSVKSEEDEEMVLLSLEFNCGEGKVQGDDPNIKFCCLGVSGMIVSFRRIRGSALSFTVIYTQSSVTLL